MKDRIKNYLPYIVFALSAVILLARAFYSFCWSDETLYLSTAYRFISGDRIFADEWFPTQLSSVILVPLMSLYIFVTGSTAGVILFFRIVYVIFSLACAIVAYRILSEDASQFVGFSSAVMLMFYTHLNIATSSYYMISVHFFLTAMLLIYHFINESNNDVNIVAACHVQSLPGRAKALLIVAGLLFAISVMALPTMAIAYVLTVIILCGIMFLGRFSRKINSAGLITFAAKYQVKEILIFTLIGIAIPAVIFFVYLLCNVSVSDFLKGIPYVLSDEEHGTSLIFPIRKMFISLNEVYHKAAYIWYALVIGCIVFRKKLTDIKYKRYVFAFDCLLFVVLALYSLGYTGYIQSALCMFALPLYILTAGRDKKIFSLIYVGGMIFSLVYSYSSNGFLYVLSTGHAIAAVASVKMIYDFIKEAYEEYCKADRKVTGTLIRYCSAAVIFYMLLCTMCLRVINIYRDAPLEKLTCRINEGPAQGLMTTPEHAASYADVYNVLTDECNASAVGHEGSILISKLLPWGYMCTDLRVAAPTCWRNNVNSARLEEYYNANPMKVPDMVLVLDDSIGSYDSCGDVEADPIPNANEDGGYLGTLLDGDMYNCKDVSCGKLYTRVE